MISEYEMFRGHFIGQDRKLKIDLRDIRYNYDITFVEDNQSSSTNEFLYTYDYCHVTLTT